MQLIDHAKQKMRRSTSEQLGPSTKRVRSAFQLVYLAVFAQTIFSLITAAVTFDLGINSEQLSATDNWFVRFVYICLLIVISVHILRLYLTMELLEEEEAFFRGFFDGLSWKTLFPEFIFRFIIIGVVTLKLYHPASFAGIFGFLATLYGAMSLWSCWMFFAAKRGYKDIFLVPSVAGALGCGLIWILLPTLIQNKANIILALLMISTLGAIGWSLYQHFREHWKHYWSVYPKKICFLTWNAGRSNGNSENTTPPSEVTAAR